MHKPPSTRVMEIFGEASSGDAAQRRAYLDRACGDDRELRAEVESLLATLEQVDHFLDAPTVNGEAGGCDTAPDVIDSRLDADTIEAGPSQVGRYTVVERIGEGGFGVVYRARQNHPIRRDVALKIVKLGMDTRQVIARFESERQALARMDHPNIARIFDAGATVDGRPYFAMELVDGPPITAWCDDKRLPIPRRLELFIQVCNAVQHAHQKGIIHRDLKPSNILVASVDGAAVPKVIDFGIAKAMDPGVGLAHTAGTEPRHLVGTPEYMSPEQAGPSNGDVDTRSDIYSLGVLLYELLTGVTPFDVRNLRPPSFEAVHRMVREDEPLKPSSRLVTLGATLADVAARRRLYGPGLRKALAGDLDCVVRKAMEKDRARRYETVGALAEDVRRYLACEAVLAGPPTPLYRLRKFARRHRRPLLAAAGVTLALLVGLAGTTFGLVRAKRDRDRAAAALAEAERVSGFLSDMLRAADPNVSRGARTVRDLLDRTARKLDGGALRDQPLVEAEVRMTVGRAYHSLSMPSESRAQVAQALSIRRRLLGTADRRTAESMSTLGEILCAANDLVGAESVLNQALAVQESLTDAPDSDRVRTLLNLSTVLRQKLDPARAQSVARRARELTQRGSVPPDLEARVLIRLGEELMATDGRGGEALLRSGLELQRRTGEEMSPETALNLQRLANVRLDHGDLAGARRDCTNALRIQREVLPEDHVDVAGTLRMLASISSRQGQFQDAEKYYRQALGMLERVFGPHGNGVAMTADQLADVIDSEGRRADAAEMRRRSADARLAAHLEELAKHPGAGFHVGGIGEARVRRCEFEQGARDLAEACRLQPAEPRWWCYLASVQNYLGDQAACRQTCRQILERFGGSTNGHDLTVAARACLLADRAPADPDRLWQMATRAHKLPYVREEAAVFCGGLAALRQGRAEKAVQLFTWSRDHTGWGPPLVATKFYLAVALRRAGQPAPAAVAMWVALNDYSDIPRVDEGDIGMFVDDWLLCQIAHREAVAVFFPDGPAASNFPSTLPSGPFPGFSLAGWRLRLPQ